MKQAKQIDLDGFVTKPLSRSTLFDTIVQGMGMVDATGRRFRSTCTTPLPMYQYVPIIAMTANLLVADRKKCRDAGMDDQIDKPVVPEQLSPAQRAAAQLARSNSRQNLFHDLLTRQQVTESCEYDRGIDLVRSRTAKQKEEEQ